MKVSEHQESLRDHLIWFYNTVQYREKSGEEICIGPAADAYIKEQLSMEEGMRQHYEAIEQIAKYNARILRAIESVKGKTFAKHLTAFIKDAEASDCPFELIKSPIGKEQEADGYGREIKKEWVVQRAVGMEGDSWEGTICLKIKENKYLKFHFSM